MKSCKICGLELIHQRDIFLVFGSSEFRPIDAIVQLPFIITGDSPYVCKQCKGSLKSWMQARDKAHKIEEELKGKYDLVSAEVVSPGNTFQPNQPENVSEPTRECKAIQTNLSFPVETKSSTSETVAFVYVSWPSCDHIRRLPSDLTQLAIYLLRTQNKNMAKFALKHPLIRAHLTTFIEKEINKECQEMCRDSVKVPTCVDSGNSDSAPAEARPKSRRDIFSTMSTKSRK